MRCHNCGNADRFVLLAELTVVIGPRRVRDPGWTLGVECPVCASTDVSGGPLDLLRRCFDRER